jgi:zinc protease
LTASVEEFIPLDGKFQMDIIMGCHGPARKSDDFLAASIGNNILGQFGMMGRIGNAVREKSGLAYYASTSLNTWMHGGSWEISAGINPNNYKKAIEIIKSELNRFIADEVSDEELDDAKSSYIGSLPLSVESNNGVANSILRMERFGLGLNYLQEFPRKVKEISKQEIRQTAQKYINPEILVTISTGPSGLDSPLPRNGEGL